MRKFTFVVIFWCIIVCEITYNKALNTIPYHFYEWKANGSTFKTVEVPVYACRENPDCTLKRNISNSVCIPSPAIWGKINYGSGSGYCACESLQVPQVDGNGALIACLSKASKLHDPCSENLQCTAGNLKYVECKSYGKCGCVLGAIVNPSNGECQVPASIGELCSSDEDCTTPGAMCNQFTKNCTCPEDSFYDERVERRACARRATKVDQDCDYSAYHGHNTPWSFSKETYSCDLIQNATCDGDTRTCRCDDTFAPVYFDEASPMKCLLKLDGQPCPLGDFVSSRMSPEWCVPFQNSEGETCEENIQCSSGQLGELAECYKHKCKCRPDTEVDVGGKCTSKSSIWNDKIAYLVFFTGLAVVLLGLLLIFICLRFLYFRSSYYKAKEMARGEQMVNPLLEDEYIYHVSGNVGMENLPENIKCRLYFKT